MRLAQVSSHRPAALRKALLCIAIGAVSLTPPASALQAPTPPGQDSISDPELAEIRLALQELDPQATPEEAMLFKQFRSNPQDVKGFLATRKYLRLLGFPKPTMDFPLPSQAPKLLDGVNYKYTLNFDEKFVLFQIFLSQGLPSQPPQ